MYKTILIVVTVLVFQAILPADAYAGYSGIGIVTSKNILSGSSASSITGFYYDLALLPGDSSVAIQFSTDNTTWYSATGVLGGSTTLGTTGGTTIDLTSLGWTGNTFYYKLTINATSDLTSSPVIESIRLEYIPNTGYDGSFVVNQSGTVGIGVSDSSYKLDVVGDVNVADGYALLFNGSRVLRGDTMDGTVYIGGIDSSITTAYLRTAGVDRMTIDADGNVGIGVTSPLSKLDVSGGVAIGSYAGSSVAPTNGLIVSGNVGIGTTTPGYKLAVSGDVYASSFIDDGITITAPDYVFDDPNYLHLSLADIEAYTEEHDHLPWLTPRGFGAMSLSARINEVLEALENIFLRVFEIDRDYKVRDDLLEKRIADLEKQFAERAGTGTVVKGQTTVVDVPQTPNDMEPVSGEVSLPLETLEQATDAIPTDPLHEADISVDVSPVVIDFNTSGENVSVYADEAGETGATTPNL